MTTESVLTIPAPPAPIVPLPGQLPLFATEKTLFGPMEPEAGGRPVSRRCTPARSGTGPEGETCGTCKHYLLVQYNDYVYGKCGLMKHAWSHGEATDIRAKWPACFEFVPQVAKSATFSPCRTWRYTLERIWDADKPYLAVIGLNPSTADETEDDPTIRRCIRFASDWGYGGLVMLNLFGFRSTDPRALSRDWCTDPVGPENNNSIRAAVSKAGETLVAWGKHGALNGRDEAVYRLLCESGLVGNVTCLDLNRDGSPKHPLYVRADIARRNYVPEFGVTRELPQ